MKKLMLFGLILFLASCKSKKAVSANVVAVSKGMFFLV